MHANVAGALEGTTHPHVVHHHAELAVEIRNPADFAAALGYEQGRITKSIFLRSVDRSRYVVAVCSVKKTLDLAFIAKRIGVDRVTMASPKELSEKLGYPSKGVSPLGCGDIPVLLDEGLLAFHSVLVGAGEPGVEVEMDPVHLQQLTGGELLPLAR